MADPTGAERYLEAKKNDPEYREAYEKALARERLRDIRDQYEEGN